MNFNCLLTCAGSQETVLMSRLIATAAIAKGFDVRGYENAYSAQWWGSVVSHVRIGQKIQSPLIPQGKVDLIIALEPAEAVRVHTFLSATGRFVVLDRAVNPIAGMDAEKKYVPEEMLAYLEAFISHPSEERAAQKGEGDWLTVIDSRALIEKCGSSTVLNTALLGVGVEKKLFPFTADDMYTALKEHILPEYLDINIRAFNVGREFAG